MSSSGFMSETLGQIAYQFSMLQPFLPTYFHLLVSALFPIFTGTHASLSKPASAAKPPKRKKERAVDSEEDDDTPTEPFQKMEGLSPSDALLYPLLTGCLLAGLYFLIKWLDDPAIINKIMNWYLSVFGILSIARLLTDSMSTITTFLFPSRYSDKGMIWQVRSKKRLVKSHKRVLGIQSSSEQRTSPLPGFLSRVTLSPTFARAVWAIRDFPSRKVCAVEAYIFDVCDVDMEIGILGLVSLISATFAVLYFNLIGKPWWLTNLLGFSFSYSALQLMSPTTFWTGTLVLTSLFFYDIYFVFFTPLMITVATTLDVPVKLLFPRPGGGNSDPSKPAFAMLGLGDIVLPGIMIGLALRFDLYLFYLKRQTRQASQTDKVKPDTVNETAQNLVIPDIITKAEYRAATGSWGERFWLSSEHHQLEGGIFPKTYFYASIAGYVTGLVCTLGVMHVFKHGQPALLYLVPGVLISLWGTAVFRGELNTMWQYSEAEEEMNDEKKIRSANKKTIEAVKKDEKAISSEATTNLDRVNEIDIARIEPRQIDDSKRKRRLFVFSISSPRITPTRSVSKLSTSMIDNTAASLKELKGA